MSLINDALKRASRPAQPNPDLPAAVPIDHPPSRSPGSARKMALLVVVVLVVVAVLLWLRKIPETVEAKVVSPTAFEKKAASNPIQQAALVANTVSESNREGEKTAVSIRALPATKAETSVAIKPVVPKTAASPDAKTLSATSDFPELKLHAIYFRLNYPTAVLNAKTVGPGDEVSGAKVLAIHRDGVEIEYRGMKKKIKID